MKTPTNEYEMIKENWNENISIIKDKKTKNLCICKKIFMKSEKEIMNAENEAKILSKLSHKNIVKYYESFKENNYLFIIMEFCSKGDLRRLIEKAKEDNKHIYQSFIKSIVLDICSGIKEIHEKNIIHRDLKPENIFISKDNTFKIGDFGISKKLVGTSHAKTGGIGTSNYIAPEVLNCKEYNNKVDIWSLGCIIYELFTLEKCFGFDENIMAMLNKINNGEHGKIDLNIYSSDWQDLIDSLLQKDPNKRPNIKDVYDKVNKLKDNVPKKITFTFARMFRGSRELQFIDISIMDTHGVFDYSEMCQDCVKLETIKLPTIYNENSKMDNMFKNCYNLKEIYLKSDLNINLLKNQLKKDNINPKIIIV